MDPVTTLEEFIYHPIKEENVLTETISLLRMLQAKVEQGLHFQAKFSTVSNARQIAPTK